MIERKGNSMSNKKIQRLNGKNTKQNKAGMVFGLTLAFWIIAILDMIFVAHDNIFLIIIVSIGIWAVGLTIAKPGQIAVSFQENGFWKTLLGQGSSQGRQGQRRRR